MNLEEIYNNPDNYIDFLSIRGPLIYRIWNDITHKSYVGFTKHDLRERLFTGMFGHLTHYEVGDGGHLYNSMRKYGLSHFHIEILSTNPNDNEKMYIDKYDSFNNGYNGSTSGLPFNEGSAIEGKIYVHKGEKSIYIKPNDIQYYLDNGWERGRGLSATGGYIRIFNPITEEATSVAEDELELYLLGGYKMGINWSTTGGKIAVHNEYGFCMIDPSELENYLKLGYKEGRGKCPTEGLIWITDGGGVNTTKIPPEDLSNYPGWYEGIGFKPNLGTVWMNKGTELIRVPEDQIAEYESIGFVQGQGRINVVNEEGINKRITLSEIPKYHSMGYQRGRYWHSSYPLNKIDQFKYLFNSQLTTEEITSSTTIEKQDLS